MKLNAKQLRDLEHENDVILKKRFPVYLVLDNVYDTYNIGGLFRLADALAIEKLYICGESEIPPNTKIKRASIGTYKVVPREYKETAIEAIGEVKNSLLQAKTNITPKIIGIEQTKHSTPYQDFRYSLPAAFVVGNETTGCRQEAIDACDAIVEIPMHGINLSLNVIISAGVVMYHAYNQLKLL